jgi:hypothetical protein
MPKKTRVDLLFRLASVGCVLLAGVISCAPAARIDVSGGWSGTMTYTSGPMTSLNSAFTMDLFDDKGTLAGSAEFPSGWMGSFEIPLTHGEVHADTIVLEFAGQNDVVVPSVPVRFTFDGQVTATSMSGVGMWFVNGTSYTFTWRATLTAPPAPES